MRNHSGNIYDRLFIYAFDFIVGMGIIILILTHL